MLRRRRNERVPATTEPILRATTEQGQVWEDPSEDLLFDLMSEVKDGTEQFLIVERLSDPSGQTYAQVIIDEGGGWLVERREGAADRHFSASLPEMRAAHEVLTGWAFELPGLESKATWEKVTF
jgi:hypothetical protein